MKIRTAQDRSEYNKQYYKDNKEKEKKRKAEWYKKNKAKIAKKHKQYYDENQSIITERNRKKYIPVKKLNTTIKLGH